MHALEDCKIRSVRPPFSICRHCHVYLVLMLKVVLVEPEIPPNTGNIIRLCANSGCSLHLIEPLGFSLSDKQLRRAGLDYHEWVNVEVYRSFQSYGEQHGMQRCFLFSKFHSILHTAASYRPGDALVFGSETAGLRDDIRKLVRRDHHLTLPMIPDSRSLNLSNAAAVAVYEAWRQIGFTGAGKDS